jgi:adenosylcobinamide kinase / adenosylcobinamide-phosphate guanylyltransferase
MGSVTFLVGGARSGKSALAVQMGQRHLGDVVFVATAEPFDDDLRDRIELHRTDRPDWPTVESPVQLAAAMATVDPHTFAIVDCLTVWVGNLFHHLPAATDRHRAVDAFMAALDDRRAQTVVISNEVGMGVHPDTALGREFCDELGRLNQRVAAVADRTLLLVAGRAVALRDPWDVL